MARYINVFTTERPPGQAREAASQYLQEEGFDYRDERGEMVWRKGTGTLANPQFIKVEIGDDGVVGLEAWTAGVSLLPGVYGGELDPMEGVMGAGPKMALRPRVKELERRLGAPQVAAAGGTAEPPAGWFPDPTGRHEHRYWDGTKWTASVADAGESSTDPGGAG